MMTNYMHFKQWTKNIMPCNLGHDYDVEHMVTDKVLNSRIKHWVTDFNKCPTCILVWQRMAAANRIYNYNVEIQTQEFIDKHLNYYEELFRDYELEHK